VIAASGLQMALPRWLSFGPHRLLPAAEVGLLCAQSRSWSHGL
jgi:hypothetical protein